MLRLLSMVYEVRRWLEQGFGRIGYESRMPEVKQSIVIIDII